MRNWLMTSLVIAALTFAPNASFAPFHKASTAYAAKKEPFSRGVALRACQAEARKKRFGFRIFARSRFIRECIKRKRAAHLAFDATKMKAAVPAGFVQLRTRSPSAQYATTADICVAVHHTI